MTQGKPNSGYAPQADSVASRVISFFEANPDEELDLDALVAKFDKPRKQWHSLLGAAVLGNLLKREERESDGELVYRPGGGSARVKAKATAPVADDALARGSWLGAKASQKPARKAPYVVDLESIKFIEGVPLPPARGKAFGGFSSILLKMPVGIMFRQPHEAKSSLSFAMTRLKNAGKGVWEMLKLPGHLGVWRVK